MENISEENDLDRLFKDWDEMEDNYITTISDLKTGNKIKFDYRSFKYTGKIQFIYIDGFIKIYGTYGKFRFENIRNMEII